MAPAAHRNRRGQGRGQLTLGLRQRFSFPWHPSHGAGSWLSFPAQPLPNILPYPKNRFMELLKMVVPLSAISTETERTPSVLENPSYHYNTGANENHVTTRKHWVGLLGSPLRWVPSNYCGNWIGQRQTREVANPKHTDPSLLSVLVPPPELCLRDPLSGGVNTRGTELGSDCKSQNLGTFSHASTFALCASRDTASTKLVGHVWRMPTVSSELTFKDFSKVPPGFQRPKASP